MFSLLSVASTYHSHGFDERKIETHVEYCRHLLDAAKVHRDAAEQAEKQTKQKLEVTRQIALADEARRRAEEQRKFQVLLLLHVFHHKCLFVFENIICLWLMWCW